MSDFIQTSKIHHYDELLAQYIIERDLARSYETELARLRKIEAAAKALITWPTGKKFFAEYWDNLLEALEQK